ncbi:MAG TPA: GGDEF domain-containing protein [Thermotogota bacterium]|nr:GGDEF domain-containing protein [Thermotogota bacterium]HPR96066.1 GGDEF domain-containing protein [Thermotogota bacterium]
MEFVQTADINIFSIIVLAILYFFSNDYKAGQSRTNDSFKALIRSVLFLIVCDLIWNIVNGNPGEPYFWINNIVNFFRNGFSVLPSMLWVRYIMRYIGYPYEKRKVYNRVSDLLFITCLILNALSPLYGLTYTIHQDNVYSRGPLYFILVIIPVVYMLLGAWFIMFNKIDYQKSRALSILSFVFFPLLGLFLQVLFFGVTLVWNFSTIAIFLIYMKVQIKEQDTDYLTGLNTRASFDHHISSIVTTDNGKKDFALMMIDIDKFKQINDEYGHKSGDEALVEFSNVLKNSVRATDFIARYGGDEFVIVIECKRLHEADRLTERIGRELERLNESGKLQYKLTFSYGVSLFSESGKENTDKFVDYVDMLMYRQKRQKSTI